MTKDDILALLGKQMQVRVTSNEKVEETLETAGENDIVLVPDGLYRHEFNLGNSIYITFYDRRKEPYNGGDDLDNEVYAKLPYWTHIAYSATGGIVPAVMNYVKADREFNICCTLPDGTYQNYMVLSTLALVSDTVTEV